MMRKAINQFPYGEAHMHIFMNGTDYKKAVADQKNGVCDRVIHAHLAEYRKRGITWLREGGDIYGTSKRTMELAPAYGITYRTPIFAIHKKGHYGAIVGRGYETMQEYRELIGDLRRQGGHFVKIMISGIMDFTHGGLTEPSLADSEIRELIHIAHEEGFRHGTYKRQSGSPGSSSHRCGQYRTWKLLRRRCASGTCSFRCCLGTYDSNSKKSSRRRTVSGTSSEKYLGRTEKSITPRVSARSKTCSRK